jgi:hypothetical protein
MIEARADLYGGFTSTQAGFGQPRGQFSSVLFPSEVMGWHAQEQQQDGNNLARSPVSSCQHACFQSW